MTRKDYIKFATLLKTLNVEFDYRQHDNLKKYIYNEIVSIFKTDNNRFDEVRFKDYISK
tara:strand:+ start:220 stop:396 length:177 start_codon:yes stop_codon:yes gene_type:complete